MTSLFRMRQRGVGGETSSSSSSSPSSSSLSAAASACVPNFEDATVSGYPPEDPHERPDDDPPPFAYEDEQEDRDIFECDDEAHANSSSNGNISCTKGVKVARLQLINVVFVQLLDQYLDQMEIVIGVIT